ncbi:MAG: TatD family hydrolase [Desulfobacterales bacterium]|nr:TatD family hydrolase [Desulfobacterales bacterium]
MKIFDTHCHIDDPAYTHIPDVIERARRSDVMSVMIAGVDAERSEKGIVLAEKYQNVYAAVGIHPHDAQTCSESILERLKSLACSHSKVKAWGEIGLDFNRMHSPQKDQEKWLARQLEVANSLNLPVIFHERDSEGRLYEILKTFKPSYNGVIHCFSGGSTDLKNFLGLGLYIGITGILTIKGRGAKLRKLVKDMPLDRIVIETDAPYLTPTPERNRHKLNEPAFVKTVLYKLSEITGIEPEPLSETIWENSCKLFNINPA